MPKAARARASIHAKPLRRAQAATGDAPGVDDQSSPGVLDSDMPDAQLAPDEEALPEPTSKKEKQLLKHEKFLQRLEASRSPYSKSHERRLKRKAKEQVASGLDEIKAAISAVEVAEGLAPAEGEEAPKKPKLAPGQIGEGKHTTLSKAQRKKALAMERMRIPKILSTPEFSSNPFQTLRKHAENTLVKHEVPA